MTAAIVQARMGSTRLPGKILKPLGRSTPLQMCLQRCQRIPGIDLVICAVPDEEASGAIEAVARGIGVLTTRGPDLDVLGRYYQAAREFDVDIIMRVTSDCPLLDPLVCGATLRLLIETGADYATNNMPPLWPHGLDCEAFPMRHLEAAYLTAKSPEEREHVSPWIRRNPSFTRANLDGPGLSTEHMRWTLDYPEDLAFFEALWKIMGDAAETANYRELIEIVQAHPAIEAINAAVGDRIRHLPQSPDTPIASIRRPYHAP